jgi:hypothetical protein
MQAGEALWWASPTEAVRGVGGTLRMGAWENQGFDMIARIRRGRSLPPDAPLLYQSRPR